jgi:hypothetical protein
MIGNFKRSVLKNLSNLPGWRTNRKIVVIESDDWGSIRMPSINAFNNLETKGIDLRSGDAERYNLFDTLASKQDLSELFEILSRYKDANGNAAVFTAVSVVANPDFKKIKEHKFQEYFYEPFPVTLERYHGDDSSFRLWKEGIRHHIFMPQFHAREHLNVAEWMRSLRAGDWETLLAFEEGVWGFNNKTTDHSKVPFQATFDLYEPTDINDQGKTIKDGLDLFENLFGYKAGFFVPPNGPFNNRLEKFAADGGIKYMSASKIQMEPQGYGRNKRVWHWLGQTNQYNQQYITRNCIFEPSREGKDWVSSCLADIENAFRWHKPAVISTHRVNYIGVLNAMNRINGLKQLDQLLKSIIKNWQGVEFCTSNELGQIISNIK